jgi:hypothetical protein
MKLKIKHKNKIYIILYSKIDHNKINKYSWGLSKTALKFRAEARINYKLVRMHRYILNISDPTIVVDHINGNPLDNRRQNLRICTQKENSRNSIKKRTNTSGYKGVSWFKRDKKWRAQIKVNYKAIHLGYFDTLKLAKQAYNQAADRYFGEFKNYG